MDPDPMVELLARLTAEEDQALASLLALANRVTRYRQYLLLGGLSTEMADELVGELHTALLANVFDRAKGDE
jgi:hypothetical protein